MDKLKRIEKLCSDVLEKSNESSGDYYYSGMCDVAARVLDVIEEDEEEEMCDT